MITTFGQSVASSSATADIAYYICIVSFFVAGGVAIYLLLDKIKEHGAKSSPKARIVKPASRKKPVPKKTTAKPVVAKKTVAKKSVVKKAAPKKAVKAKKPVAKKK